MDVDKLKEEYVGKRLLMIISLDTKDESIKSELRKITKYEYGEDIDNAQLLLFEDNKALVFVDFDSDGYRSGSWFLINLDEMLDKGHTQEIKDINSVIKDIEYFKTTSDERVIITTNAYVISMGQNNFDDYYPNNFFDIKDIKQAILDKLEK